MDGVVKLLARILMLVAFIGLVGALKTLRNEWYPRVTILEIERRYFYGETSLYSSSFILGAKALVAAAKDSRTLERKMRQLCG